MICLYSEVISFALNTRTLDITLLLLLTHQIIFLFPCQFIMSCCHVTRSQFLISTRLQDIL